MYHICEACGKEIPYTAEEQELCYENEDDVSSIPCPECKTPMENDNSPYLSRKEYLEDMDEYMYPNGHDDGEDLDKMFGGD